MATGLPPSMLTFGDTLTEARENAGEELVVCLQASELLDDPFSDLQVE